jgi:hypothetical protein
MLKITISETATEDRWILLRRLLGPWVGELKKVWRNAHRSDKQQLSVFDLNDVLSTIGLLLWAFLKLWLFEP